MPNEVTYPKSRQNDRGQITDVPGVTVGHYTDLEGATGCTAVLVDKPAVGGVDIRGTSTGTRETQLLDPLARIEHIHGIMLSGGSAFGLEAATGAVRFLEEQGRGLKIGRMTIPLVPSAIIFDLNLGSYRVRPNAHNGYSAAETACVTTTTGSIGAGTGATVGKLRGQAASVKSGLGTASVSLEDGLIVGALVVMNAIGSVIDPDTGSLIAGPRTNKGFENTLDALVNDPPRMRDLMGLRNSSNTVVGVVATNAGMDKKAAIRLAAAGQDAIAMCVRPAHMAGDGDTIFALATGTHPKLSGKDTIEGIEDRLRAAAVQAMVGAIQSSVEQATGLAGVPSSAEHLASIAGKAIHD